MSERICYALGTQISTHVGTQDNKYKIKNICENS